MKRTVLALVVVLGLMVNMCASAMATENRVSQINPTLTFSGTTANCGVVIISIGDEIDATLELWKGNILIDSWPSKGTSVTVKSPGV